MNQLLGGVLMVILGATLLMVYNRAQRTQRESAAFEWGYLKNVGIGFILFGVYYLAKYFTS